MADLQHAWHSTDGSMDFTLRDATMATVADIKPRNLAEMNYDDYSTNRANVTRRVACIRLASVDTGLLS